MKINRLSLIFGFAMVTLGYPAEKHCAISVTSPPISCETGALTELKKCKVGPPSCAEAIKLRSDLTANDAKDFILVAIYFHNIESLDEYLKKFGIELNDYDAIPTQYWERLGNELTDEEKKDPKLTKNHACKYLKMDLIQAVKDQDKKKVLLDRCGWAFKSAAAMVHPSFIFYILGLFFSLCIV